MSFERIRHMFSKCESGAPFDCKVEVFTYLVFDMITERIAQVTADKIQTMTRTVREL
jgi:hypothetical protein